ncbi:carboxymuconolactone decarboxylase family protein [Actinocorallia populi]|uniref:carboxymuconolactone decarboxylase family protein n=1 Tax=Actinocorallia populi TaxID=2079200 RepID=UPI000D095230|nr:carboxymuconolactone decarboxylase family protein [Actinocorallia populi]
MSGGAARIPPLPRAEWSPQLAEFISGYRSAVRSDGPEEERQSGANLLGTLARHPALAKAFLTFSGHLLSGGSLSVAHRELLVLRVAHVRRCDYEWAQHVILAEKAGVRPEEIARIPDGPDAPGWPPFERALLSAVDELLADGAVSGGTWKALAAEFDDRQLMDVVFTVGAYELVAMALRSFGVRPEPALVPYLPGYEDAHRP